MRNTFLMLISACLYYSGFLKLMRWWTEHIARCVIILNYHEASGGDLRSHFLYLRSHYRITHLATALDELYMPHKADVRRRDRRTALVLTFDDGYADNYTHAYALACELEIPITIFLIQDYIGCGNAFWWLDRLIRHARVDEAIIEGRLYHLRQQEECKALAQIIDTRVRHAVSPAEREEFLASVRKILAVPSSVELKEELLPLLTWEQVKEMEKSKWVSFGAHTLHHPILTELAEPVEVQHEVGESRTRLEKELSHAVTTFAYPYGRAEHIGDNGLCAVRQAGFDWAVTTIPGFNTSRNDRYLLRRIFVDTKQHWLVIAAKTAGVWNLVYRMTLLQTKRNTSGKTHAQSRLMQLVR